MTDQGQCILSIAIPTWNRAGFLQQNLRQLNKEISTVPDANIEVIVSDNCSTDQTSDVVREAVSAGLAVRYIRNKENIGWGRNFFQCFNLAAGRYVMVLGDDDFLLDGTLARVIEQIDGPDFGVVCIRPFGFDHDFQKESMGTAGKERVFTDTGEFLVAIGALATMISACIVNKRTMGGIDTDKLFCGDLAHLHLVLLGASSTNRHLFIDRPLIACKRNNSSNYKFSKVFVQEYWALMDEYVAAGLPKQAVRRIQSRLLFSYYPFYLLLERLANNGDHKVSAVHFSERFGNRMLYRLWVAPILHFPRILALAWAVTTTVIGRVCDGELRRGLHFAASKLRRPIAKKVCSEIT